MRNKAISTAAICRELRTWATACPAAATPMVNAAYRLEDQAVRIQMMQKEILAYDVLGTPKEIKKKLMLLAQYQELGTIKELDQALFDATL